MARRGFVRYFMIQWGDGLLHFLFNPPTVVDLSRTVVVPGPYVRFSQTDFNRHFTVREIVRDSERGMYNLVHVTGLAHLEHHFAVMFFASDIKATFTKEIVEGER